MTATSGCDKKKQAVLKGGFSAGFRWFCSSFQMKMAVGRTTGTEILGVKDSSVKGEKNHSKMLLVVFEHPK